MLHFTVNGTEYEYDQDKLPLTEAIAVKKATGLTVNAYMRGLTGMDPEALQAMVWLAKQRAGEAVRFVDIEFDVLALIESLRELDPAIKGDEAADPTTPSESTSKPAKKARGRTGTSPPSGEPTTSASSPTTSD